MTSTPLQKNVIPPAPAQYISPCELYVQAGEAPTEDVEKDWERSERDRSQLWDMKRQVRPTAKYLYSTSAAKVHSMAIIIKVHGCSSDARYLLGVS